MATGVSAHSRGPLATARMCCGGRADLGATDQTERSDGVAIRVSLVAVLFSGTELFLFGSRQSYFGVSDLEGIAMVHGGQKNSCRCLLLLSFHLGPPCALSRSNLPSGGG